MEKFRIVIEEVVQPAVGESYTQEWEYWKNSELPDMRHLDAALAAANELYPDYRMTTVLGESDTVEVMPTDVDFNAIKVQKAVQKSGGLVVYDTFLSVPHYTPAGSY